MTDKEILEVFKEAKRLRGKSEYDRDLIAYPPAYLEKQKKEWRSEEGVKKKWSCKKHF